MASLRTVGIAVFFVWLIADGVVVFGRRGSQPERRDRLSMLAIIVANWIGITLAFLFASFRPGTLGSATIPLQIVGLLLMAVGIFVRSLAIAQLGRFHMPVVAIQAGHHIVDTGLYRYVRHPSYLGAFIAFLGFGLALGSWLSAVLLVAVALAAYLYRIHVEEQALVASLGEAYSAYRARTWRLIPGLY